MNTILFSFLLTILAGFSTLIGTILIFIIKKKTDNIIIGALSFASGVMISVSVIDLIPESFKLISQNILPFPSIILCLIFFTIGMILSMIIDHFFPGNDQLYRVGFISLIAIIMHNIPEGIATFLTTSDNIKLGINLSLAIALHNIPEGICISLPIYYATKSRGKAFIYTLISALSEPFGALIAYLFLTPFISNLTMGLLYSIIAGIMIHISIYELLPTALKYQKKLITILSFIIGFIIMILSINI